MPVIQPGQVAIFYSLATGALLGKLVLALFEYGLQFDVPAGQGVILQDTSLLYDDETCYAIIAANTTFKPDQNTDRCVVLDKNGTVVAVHKRDPSILPVQPGEGSLMLHLHAGVGDTLAPNKKSFQRRYVRISIQPKDSSGKRNGKVTGIASATVDETGVKLPNASNKTELVRRSNELQSGDLVDLSDGPPGLLAIIAASGV